MGGIFSGDRQKEIDHRVTEDTEIGERKREKGGEFDRDNAMERRQICSPEGASGWHTAPLRGLRVAGKPSGLANLGVDFAKREAFFAGETGTVLVLGRQDLMAIRAHSVLRLHRAPGCVDRDGLAA